MFICERGFDCVECPRIDPEEKCDHWIEVRPVIYAHWVWSKGHWKCSKCGCIRDTNDLVLGLNASFCGYCGATMKFKPATDKTFVPTPATENVPPIQIGTTVYFRDWDDTVGTGVVSMLQQKADKSWRFRVSHHSHVSDYPASELGKSIFLTHREAEDYSKEMRAKKKQE